MREDLPTVELKPAYFWICDACGRENFGCPVALDNEHFAGTEAAREAEEDLAEIRELLSHQNGDIVANMAWLSHPDCVTCASCKATFRAEIGDD